MSVKSLFLLAIAVGGSYASQCGIPAVKPQLSGSDALIAYLTGRDGGRIIGGIEATPNSWPWQVAVTSDVFCGGSIIDNEWVMTAAHCCLNNRGQARPPTSVTVRAGAHAWRSPEDTSKSLRVSRVVPHPKYNSQIIAFDLCLLKLAEPLVFTDAIQPVCLADATDGPAGQTCYMSGWGSVHAYTFPNRPPPQAGVQERLQQVDVKIVSQAECSKLYSAALRPATITSDMICARQPNKGGCQGDSGGPLVCQSGPDAPFKLVGAVSWGYGCGDNRYATVFGRISHELQWIAATMLE